MLKRNKENLEFPKLRIEKNGKKKINKTVFKGIFLVLIFLLLICTLYSLFTPSSENVLVSGARKVLASVGVYTEEIKSVEIKSEGYDKQEGGSWHIDKSADWIGLNKAQINFDLNTVVKTGGHLKDVVFVLDISGSMDGDKLERVKEDTKELIEYLLSNSNNRVALITFESTSTILSEFTNDKDKLIELIDSLSVTGATNYNIALSNVDKVLEGYTRENNRDLVTLFLTDGYPNEDTPNQIATYKVLKDKYPYMTINGVQYEMGKNIIQDIIDISDNQFVADMESLNNVLFEASITPWVYESFEIVDYIDKEYWYVENESDIKVDKGYVRLEEENGLQKVIWSFEDGELRTGEPASMAINIKLKEQYVGTKGFYPTNEKEIISYKVSEKDEVKETSSKTPVLKNGYKVTYESNAPSNCTVVMEDLEEIHYAFESVTKRKDKLTCDGYIFKGWEIANQGVKKVNDEIFVMPSEDVTIRGIWTKPVIAKSMEGEVRKKLTLYKQVREDFNNTPEYVKKYNGKTDTFLGDKDIYHYYGAAANNNVIFANYCWKIIRTTDTGGVKLLYNGVPSESGICNNDREKSALTKTQMGTSNSTIEFNSNYKSLADVGYMYNTRYTHNRKLMSHSQSLYDFSYMSSGSNYSYYYSDTYDYRNNTYYLYPTDNPAVAEKIPWIETITDEEGNTTTKNNYENLVGKYTCLSTSSKYCTKLYYVINTFANHIYYIELKNGNSLEEEKIITLSPTIAENDDGTYTLTNPVTIEKEDWGTDGSNYQNYYTCGNNELTCKSMKYIYSLTSYYFNYVDFSIHYKYGNYFSYNEDTKQYTLINTSIASIKDVADFENESDTLKNNHYTCWNDTGICSTISYINYVRNDVEAYYINLTGGKSIEDALNEMLYNDDVNTKDSTIKTAIDYWYEHNMTDYTEYLEDTYWCNDRSIDSLSGWNPNGGAFKEELIFNEYASSNLTCANKNDRFTVSIENGNGKLKYPVGLITKEEASLSYASKDLLSPLASHRNGWTLTPDSFSFSNPSVYNQSSFGGSNFGNSVNFKYDVRPSISLRAGIEYTDGDGSVNKPYIIDTSIN